jgi:hypothetical protein
VFPTMHASGFIGEPTVAELRSTETFHVQLEGIQIRLFHWQTHAESSFFSACLSDGHKWGTSLPNDLCTTRKLNRESYKESSKTNQTLTDNLVENSKVFESSWQ